MLNKIIIFLITINLFTACKNSIVFYQAQRVSFTLETNPVDVSKPVQGNLGFKSRTFISNPKVDDGKKIMTLLSDADFAKDDKSNALVFKTAIFSGKAAVALGEKGALAVTQAITQVPNLATQIDNVISNVISNRKMPELKLMACKNYSDLSKDEEKRLWKITGFGRNYKERQHNELKHQITTKLGCP
jgi:hypothetical protein